MTYYDAPQNCPGPQSETAGNSSACAGCPNQTLCQTTPKGPDPDLPIIKERLAPIENILLVMSGKGGVGKSTLSFLLSQTFAYDESEEVGLLDIDLCGPSIPLAFGIKNESVHQSQFGWSPIYATQNLGIVSMGAFIEGNESLIWRSQKKTGMIKQFLRDVYWENLDYLIVDTPPGTSDEHLSICQYLKDAREGSKGVHAILVTTGMEISLMDVRKEIGFCKKIGIPILGVVENMSYLTCPCCNKKSEVFTKYKGGAEKMCQDLNVPFLGALPMDPQLMQAMEKGFEEGWLEDWIETENGKVYLDIVEKIKTSLQ